MEQNLNYTTFKEIHGFTIEYYADYLEKSRRIIINDLKDMESSGKLKTEDIEAISKKLYYFEKKHFSQ